MGIFILIIIIVLMVVAALMPYGPQPPPQPSPNQPTQAIVPAPPVTPPGSPVTPGTPLERIGLPMEAVKDLLAIHGAGTYGRQVGATLKREIAVATVNVINGLIRLVIALLGIVVLVMWLGMCSTAPPSGTVVDSQPAPTATPEEVSTPQPTPPAAPEVLVPVPVRRATLLGIVQGDGESDHDRQIRADNDKILRQLREQRKTVKR